MDKTEKLLLELLKHNKSAVHPGGGKADAKLVRKICDHMGWDEDDFLPRFVVRDKRSWGIGAPRPLDSDEKAK
jgi:hypothetical protein